MYRLNSKEQDDLSMKRWITITKEDALSFKNYATLDNLKYVVQIYKKLLESDEKSKVIEIEDEELFEFISSQDWLYNYDEFQQFNYFELSLIKQKLEELLEQEKLRFKELMNTTLPSDEYIAILEYLIKNISKYRYQIHSVDNLMKEKFSEKELKNNAKAK